MTASFSAMPAASDDALAAARAALAAGQWQHAINLAQQVQASNPGRRDTWRVLAEAHNANGQVAQALAALDHLRALTPPAEVHARLELLALRHRYALRLEQTRELETILQKLARSPTDHLLLNAKMDLLRRLGRDMEALDAARQLTAHAGPTPRQAAAQWLARARLARRVVGDMEEVRTAAAQAQRLAPDAASVQQACAALLAPLGQPERFPARLADLGYEQRLTGDAEVLVPPMCWVQAGAFLMGSDPLRDDEAYPDEQPVHRVTLPSYAIGRFPVTVAEYALFLVGGYTPPPNWAVQRNTPDHPVRQVSWLDACAYARWLARTTGQRWRLPTEAEWEKAARWNPALASARIYPWGNAFDASRCNTSLAAVASTSPVGRYADDASAYELSDLCGNVWEWTSSPYRPYPHPEVGDLVAPGRVFDRVVRGGSWRNEPRLARSACRGHRVMLDFDSDVGFRLVRASQQQTGDMRTRGFGAEDAQDAEGEREAPSGLRSTCSGAEGCG